MSDIKSIDDLIGIAIEDNETERGMDDDRDEVATTATDQFAEVMGAIRSLTMSVESMDKRLAKVEVEVSSMKKDWSKPRPRAMASLPNPDALRHTVSPSYRSRASDVSVNRDEDAESFVSVSRSRSEASSQHGNMNTNSYMDRIMSPGVFSNSAVTAIKSNSATANRGYDNKTSLWGTCFASLLMSCMTKYISFTGESGHVIDGAYLMRVYTNIAPELYDRVKSAGLPAVQSQASLFMSKVFIRKDKTTFPESTVKDWWEISKHADGAECMSVIESMFIAAKMVPEAMMHPISQLVDQMNPPVVREGKSGPTYAIPTAAKITMSPLGPENFCRCLKMASLRVYVKYRLQGDNEVEAASKMMTTMKDTDLFDNKNLHRGREMIRTMSVDTT